MAYITCILIKYIKKLIKYQFVTSVIVKYKYKPHCISKTNTYLIQLAASRPRMSETEPKRFQFETSCYAFGGRIHRFSKVNMNEVNMFYGIVLIQLASCSFRCALSVLLHGHCIYQHSVTAAQNNINEVKDRLTDKQTNTPSNKSIM